MNSKNSLSFSQKSNYVFGKQLGCGAFGKVFQAIDKIKNRDVAIKVLQQHKLDDEVLKKIDHEIFLMFQLSEGQDNPNLIKFYDNFSENNEIYIVMEYCKFGDLQQLFETKLKQRVDEDLVRCIINQLLYGYLILQAQKIVHRDLKLGNLLVSSDFTIKLADFGLASSGTTNMMQSFAGTPMIMAPEIMKHKEYDLKCDIFSIGVMTYQLLTGEYPFNPQKKTLEQLLFEIEKNEVNFPKDINISENGQNLIRRMLKADPSERIDFLDLFNSDWVGDINIDQLKVKGLKIIDPNNAVAFENDESYEINTLADMIYQQIYTKVKPFFYQLYDISQDIQRFNQYGLTLFNDFIQQIISRELISISFQDFEEKIRFPKNIITLIYEEVLQKQPPEDSYRSKLDDIIFENQLDAVEIKARQLISLCIDSSIKFGETHEEKHQQVAAYFFDLFAEKSNDNNFQLPIHVNLENSKQKESQEKQKQFFLDLIKRVQQKLDEIEAIEEYDDDEDEQQDQLRQSDFNLSMTMYNPFTKVYNKDDFKIISKIIK